MRRKNCTWKPRLSGSALRGKVVSVTKPDWFVTCSGGVDVTSGVERTKTSAPRTQKPRESDTWTRTETGPRRDVTTLGVKCTPSITRRAGGVTLVTGIEIFPLASLICPSGPDAVVVVVELVVVVGVDVDVEVELEVVLLVLDVELVEVESAPVDVESASTLNGPVAPALAR